ncbi:MAG: hypothetical protein J5995_06880 [Muribaculaceae bacterium]|nr:hypothetical protein [Muribaculaceae bacterium]
MKTSRDYSLSEQTQILVKNGRYKDAFTLLRRRLTEFPIPRQLNRLSQTESTYRYLLQYFASGASDPGRASVLADIRNTLLSISSIIEKEQYAADSSQQFYSTLRMCRMHPADIEGILASLSERKAMLQLAESAGAYSEKEERQLEEEEGKLFETLWTADSIPAESYRAISKAIARGSLPASSTAAAIAGAGLGAMQWFSPDAVMLLCDAASSADSFVAARAMTHLIFVMHRWSGMIKDNPAIMQRLEALTEQPGMKKRMASAVLTAIRTRDTSRVSRKMERDVIPGLMQLGPDILKKLRDASQESSFADLEANPEWEEILEKTGLQDKLRDLSEMQSDGADVMMVAFSNMKGYPFFRKIQNWLMPFSTRHSSLSAISDNDRETIGEVLSLNFMMCNSDKYSFAFALSAMPETQRRMVSSQMKGQMEMVSEQMKEITGLGKGEVFESELLGYMRDLYRLHRLHPRKSELPDPFGEPLDIAALPVAGDILAADAETLRNAADFYFNRRYYSEAYTLFTRLATLTPDMPHLWEKAGFCIEKAKDSGDREKSARMAIEAYMKARLFNPDSRWISRRLGICYRATGDLRNAAECIREAMPETEYDHTLTILLAGILYDDGKWEEALTTLYRSEYERPGDPEVLRLMSKSAIMCGKADKAAEWMAMIPAIELQEDDYRIKGHISLILGNIPEAMRNYRLTVRPNDDKRIWKNRILADAETLAGVGIDRDEILLLTEAMAYGIE